MTRFGWAVPCYGLSSRVRSWRTGPGEQEVKLLHIRRTVLYDNRPGHNRDSPKVDALIGAENHRPVRSTPCKFHAWQRSVTALTPAQARTACTSRTARTDSTVFTRTIPGLRNALQAQTRRLGPMPMRGAHACPSPTSRHSQLTSRG
jgi:hypothetical protein